MVLAGGMLVQAAFAEEGVPAPDAGGPFRQTPVLSVRGRDILADGKPVRGMFVFWHIPGDAAEREEEVRAELARIRRLGFTGISIEAGWDTCFPEEGRSALGATAADSVLRWAAEEGLWAQVLLTPHYVPSWVFDKHGDIRMRGPGGEPVTGHFLPFSPYSPAVADLVAFQQAAVRHFSQYPNVLCFWLTNETGFGKDWADFSEWGLEAWRQWLRRVDEDAEYWSRRWGGQPVRLEEVSIPPPDGSQARADWARFRRLSLIEFRNRLFDEARRARPRFIPIGHKLSPYQAIDAFASPFGLHPAWSQWRADVLGFDNYDVSAGLLALQESAPVPVIIAETNLQRTAETLVGGAKTLRMLLRQHFAGAGIQTMYAWNAFDAGAFPWGMRCEDGTLLRGAEAAVAMAELMREWREAAGAAAAVAPVAAVVLPAGALSLHSEDHERFQGMLDVLADIVHRAGASCLAVTSDDLVPGAYLMPGGETPRPPDAPAGAAGLRGLPESVRVLFVPDDGGLDEEFLGSAPLMRWVEGGGILVLGFREKGPPGWTGIRQARRSGLRLVSTTPASARWAFRQRDFIGPSVLELAGGEGPPPEIVVTAVLEGSQEPVALRVRRGEGWVVYAGIPVTAPGLRGRDAGYAQDALELAGVLSPAVPPGPRIHIRDGLMLLWTDSDWTGRLAAPGEVASLRVFDRDGLPVERPYLQASGGTVSGTLYEGQFALVRLRSPDGGRQHP